MPTTQSTQTAQVWLQTARCPPQRVGEVACAIALLEGPIADYRQPFAADVEMALLVEADSRGRFDLVQILCDQAQHKPTAKHAKKLLFKARQRGVAVPDRPVTRRAVDLSARPDPLPSFASSFDGSGGQLLFLGGWSPTDGAWCVMGMVSDEEGLLSAYYLADSSRTQQRDLLTRLKGQFHGFTVEVPDAFAAGRMRWGLDLRDQLGQPFDGDLPEVRRLLQSAEPIQAVDLALDPEDEARVGQYMDEAAPLVTEPCFSAWLAPGPGPLGRLQAELAALRTQDLDAEGLRRAVATARSAAVENWLNDADRARMADRLDITSWLLVEDGRRDLAMRALATARGLRDLEQPLEKIAFVSAAVDKRLPIDHLVAFVRGAAASLEPVVLRR